MRITKSFIALDNNFFNINKRWFNAIKTEGFTIYSYLLAIQGNRSFGKASINDLISTFNVDYDNRPSVKYSESKINKISTIKDKRVLIKYIKLLETNKLISLVGEIPKSNNANFTFKCIANKEDGFTPISDELFIDYISKIGYIGWSILCLLTNLHNNTFGGVGCCGFCNPSEEYISKILKKDIKTIQCYLKLLEKLKLIKIENQTPIFTGLYSSSGKEIYEFITNHYIVKNRLSDNKYNLNN
jgi:hypothetical protein